MPKLVVFKDAALVTIFQLDAAKNPFFIGRKSENDLVLAHSSVSRQHVKVFSKEQRFQVMDLDSLNGITVNGNKVTKAQLADGDTVGVGDFTLIFHEEVDNKTQLLAPPSVKAATSLRDEANDTLATAPKGDFKAVKDSYAALQALFLLVTRFQSILDYNQLLQSMIDCLLEIFAAERGFILLYTSKSGKFDMVVSRGIGGEEYSNTVSRTIALQVAKERTSILITDAEADVQYQQVESIKRQQVRSIICAPLLKKQKTVGVVYLDSKVSSKIFTSRDISFLTAFTQHAADAIERAQDREKMVKANQNLTTLHRSDSRRAHDFESVVGTGPAISAMLDTVRDVASEDVTAIILGESGTGKELLAKAIHFASPRAGKPFVAVNCMALSEDLIESELFGHEKGSFSGALEARVGRFELADGGTLFLDEVGELSMRVQVKLLRVLQERQIERVGGNWPVDIDVRIICATNADLEKAVQEGRFRQDLYYRMMVFPIRIPPLRERREDIPALVEHYINRFNGRMARKHSGIEDDALAMMVAYDWPGNVRELINVVERAFLIEKGDRITSTSLPKEMAQPAPVKTA
jgi:Nif-specific regulatory protein